jgi:membrane protease YdiL (CAAX protease family)
MIMNVRLTYRAYVMTVFLLSYLWQLVIFLTGGVESRFFPFVMFFPGLVALLFRLGTKAGFKDIGWGLRKGRYLFLAIFIPLGFTVGIVWILITFGWATLIGFTFSDNMLVGTRFGLLLGNHSQSILFFALNLTVSFMWTCLISTIFTLGEEFGWQGFLMQKLLERFGLNRGLFLLGIVWGYWHLPIILMGFNFPNHPVLGALVLMPIGTIFIGIVAAWLYLRSRSIWMPALLHASGNTAAGFLFSGLTMNQDELLRQLLWLAGWGLISFFCLISLNRTQPQLWQEAGQELPDGQLVRHQQQMLEWS